AGDGLRQRAHPHAARQAVAGPVGNRRGLPQRGPGAAGAAQPQRELQFCRGREPDHGHQGRGRVVRLGLHLGLARALVRAARAGTQRRIGAQLDPLHRRAVHDGGGDRLYGGAGKAQNRQAARTITAVGDASGRHRSGQRAMGCALSAPEEKLMAYSDKVLDHYENPRNVGSFAKDESGVGTGMVGAPACGDVMKLQIKVGADGRIEDAKFKTYGCGSAIASSSLVTEWVKGKTLDQATSIKNTQIAEELALPPVKIHCSILAEDAIKAAVADYRKKHASASE